jgi:hypothetical protein
MFYDFQFRYDERLVLCTRGLPSAAPGHSPDRAWWYLSVGDAPPVRLLRVYPGETRQEVWESALRHLDETERLVPEPAEA